MITLGRFSFIVAVFLPLLSCASALCYSQVGCLPLEAFWPCHHGECFKHAPVDRQSTMPEFPSTLDDLKAAVNAVSLTRAERLSILNASIIAFEQIHVYRNLHLHVRNIDPAALLRNLSPRAHTLSPFAFHTAVRSIYQRVNDYHTTYLPPDPLRRAVASLPFLARVYYPRDGAPPRVAVATVLSAALPIQSKLAPGVRILALDGVPVIRMVRALGRAGYAGNEAAKLSRGVLALSVRALAVEKFPQRSTVLVSYISSEGKVRTDTLRWSVSPISDPFVLGSFSRNSVREMQTPQNDAQEKRIPNSSVGDAVDASNGLFNVAKLTSGLPIVRQPLRRTDITVPPPLSNFFSAYILETKSGSIGVLRLPNFGARDNLQTVIDGLSRVLKQMPSNGLVIDLRDNVGGDALHARAVTELFSNVLIPNMSVQVRITPTTRRIIFSRATNPFAAALTVPLRRPFLDAAMLKEELSPPTGNLFQLGKLSLVPRQKRVYTGPVITLTNALTFSAAEIFTAIQRDLGASLVVGTDSTTAGGGCAPIRYTALYSSYPDALLNPIPDGVDFGFCGYRFFRLGPQNGVFIEARGVPPNIRYFTTLRDVVDNDVDMFNFLGKKLSTVVSR